MVRQSIITRQFVQEGSCNFCGMCRKLLWVSCLSVDLVMTKFTVESQNGLIAAEVDLAESAQVGLAERNLSLGGCWSEIR